jgi:putative phosphoribosyl transferase
MHDQPFPNRRAAGRALAAALGKFAGRPDVIVLALPRGGVPIAYEVARAIGAPFDVFLVRKLGVPGHEELGFGALASGGVRILNDEVVQTAGIDSATIEGVTEREALELARRDRTYRGDREHPRIEGRVAIIVDDGLATGSTMRVAIEAVRSQRPSRIVVAAPVAPLDTCQALREVVDEVVCLSTPDWFDAIGRWYVDFSPTTDDEVRDLLAAGRKEAADAPDEPGRRDQSSASDSASASASERPVEIPAGGVTLHGDLVLPPNAAGLVVFAHGSGSSRHSPRNRFVAGALQAGGLGTLLLDLLTEQEEVLDERTAELRFDIGLLAHRLTHAVDWAAADEATRALPVGIFGASTGAAAAIAAAVRRPGVVRAVVSRGGRPDMAGDDLPALHAPTFFIVGGADAQVLALNRQALELMPGEKKLEVVPGATHLFEEPGALDRVALLARKWLTTHLATSRGSTAV